MKKIVVTLLILLSTVAYGDEMKKPLNRVAYQVASEQWVQTKSAEVTVTIDATLGKAGLAEARASILTKLSKIADAGKWHITRFDRSQDRSGLERLSVEAQARIPEAQLANLHSHAKSVSRDGETYRIANIDFTPTLVEVETVRASVREDLYNKVNAELSRLNKSYPDQKFEVHSIDFTGRLPEPRAKGRVMAYQAVADEAVASPIIVSNKVRLNAMIVLAG